MVDLNKLVAEQIKGMEFGSIQLMLKVHRGALNKVDISKSTSVKIEGSNPDADAAGIIISVMKATQTQPGNGSLGFSILRRAGKPILVQVQEYKEERA